MYWNKAIELAKNGVGKTSPNPAVGAVIVRGEKIIAEGWHRRAGKKHAEVEAILNAGKKSLKGAFMYVTLEPCCHSGKTGPCCEVILGAGIKKVFVGMKDPNPLVSGKGIEFLRKNGVQVELLDSQSEEAYQIRSLNQAFIKQMQTGLPYVTLKAGMSLDGRIATGAGVSKWITGEVARRDARETRKKYDAVLLGGETVRKDDPELMGVKKRIVFSESADIPLSRKIFRDENVLLLCGKDADTDKFEKKGVEVKKFANLKNVRKVLVYLSKVGVQSLFVEGGAQVHGIFHDAFLKDRALVDRALFYISPRILGGRGALAAVAGKGVKKPGEAPMVLDYDLEVLEDGNLRFEGWYNFY